MKNKSLLSTPSFTCFTDFWQHYLNQHQHPVNRMLHAAGTIGSVIGLGLALCLSWMWLLVVPSIGYGLAWLGHFLVERNRPLTFTYPLWSLMADYRLVVLMLMGHRLSAREDSDSSRSRNAA